MPRTLGYFCAIGVVGMSAASLGPTLLGLAEHTQSQLSQISLIFTARQLGYILGALATGRIYDRIPGHPLIAVLLGTMAAMLALVPLVSSLWLLMPVFLMLGMCEGSLLVGTNTLLVWVHGDNVSRYFYWLHFFAGLGGFLAPGIVAQTYLVSGNIAWAYWVMAALIIVAIFPVIRAPSPPAQAAANEGHIHASDILPIGLIASFLFLYVGAEVIFSGWIFSYAVALNLSNVTTAAYLTSTYWATLTAGRLLILPVTRRVSPLVILVGALAGCLASVGAILFWFGSGAAIWIGTVGVGLSMSAIWPSTLNLGARRTTTTGHVTSWFFVGANAGAMSLPWLVGQYFESVGPQFMMFTIVCALTGGLATLFILSRVPSPTKRTTHGTGAGSASSS